MVGLLDPMMQSSQGQSPLLRNRPSMLAKKSQLKLPWNRCYIFPYLFVYKKPYSTASIFCTVTLDSRPLEPNVFPLHSRTLDTDNDAVEQHARKELIQKYIILQPDPDTITNCFCTVVTICVLKEINFTDEF
jgi:hypothetical protein